MPLYLVSDGDYQRGFESLPGPMLSVYIVEAESDSDPCLSFYAQALARIKRIDEDQVVVNRLSDPVANPGQDRIVIETHYDVTDLPDSEYKRFLVSGNINGKPLRVWVTPFDGGYDYETSVPEDDEPIQIAIGQYFEDNNIDVGLVGR